MARDVRGQTKRELNRERLRRALDAQPSANVREVLKYVSTMHGDLRSALSGLGPANGPLVGRKGNETKCKNRNG